MERNLDWIRAIGAHLLTALFAVFASLYVSEGLRNGASIMSFSPELSVLRFVQENASLSDDELLEATQEFDAEMTRAAQEFAAKYDVVLLRDSQILSGVQDATPYILDKVFSGEPQ